MAALYTAFDLTGLEANIVTALTVGVGVTLVFLGYKYIKKMGWSL